MASKLNKINKIRQGIFKDLQLAANSVREIDSYSSIYNKLRQAATQVKNSENNDSWEYEISDMELPIKQERHIKPNGQIDNLHLYVDVKIKALFEKWDECNDGDPFADMNFRVKIVGDSNNPNNYFEFGLHIDRTNEADSTEEVHPLYHIHYFNNSKVGDPPVEALSMDAPRLVHHPLEVIVGILFTLANFNKDLFIKLKENSYYRQLAKKYSEKFQKPYFEYLNNHLQEEREKSDMFELCPYII